VTGDDVPRTSEHDVDRLAALVVTGLKVKMVVYGLEVPFGLLESQSILLILLGVFLLFSLPLAGRRTVIALLLQLLAALFREFLDFLALLSIVALRVVNWATRTSVIVVRCLMGALVTLRASAPTHRGSTSYGGGSSSQRLVIAACLLLFLVLVLILVLVLAATSLGSSTHFGLDTLPRLWSRWGVLGTALCGPGTLVRLAEELCDILDVMRDELLQHLLIPHTLAKCNHNTSIGYTRNGVANLGKPLNEGA
jgi:hypothetical protein